MAFSLFLHAVVVPILVILGLSCSLTVSEFVFSYLESSLMA